MKKFTLTVLIVVLVFFVPAIISAKGNRLNNRPGKFVITQKDQQSKKESTAKAEKVVYTCPMHPEEMSDKPGKCPKCGMNLVKKEVKAVYTCSMHPEVISDKPGKCPKCGMNLVVKESGNKKKSTEPMKGM
jgi:hypothetical protein